MQGRVGIIATIATGEWLKLCTGWQMSSVNIASGTTNDHSQRERHPAQQHR
jgi:hypothetical protein